MTRRRRWWWEGIVAVVAAITLPAVPVGAAWTFIPIPEVIVDPNEGTTGGVMPALLHADDEANAAGGCLRRSGDLGRWPAAFTGIDYPF